VALKQTFSTSLSGESVASLELHDISFEENEAAIAGTVYWFFDSSRVEGSHEPAGLSAATLTWVNNQAPHGKKYCTQPVYLDVSSSYEVTVYNAALEPGNISSFGCFLYNSSFVFLFLFKFMRPMFIFNHAGIHASLRDYYHQLAVSSNSSMASLEVEAQQCFPKFGFIQSGQVEQAVMGEFHFLNLEMTCYPEGNVTLLAQALVVDIASIGLSPADFPVPQAQIEVVFRACVAGETVRDASCLECGEGFYLLEFEKSLAGITCTACPGEAELCHGNQIILKPGNVCFMQMVFNGEQNGY
jgi:hypothetical protein